LKLGFDTVLSLGQAPGSARVAIEGVGLNVARDRGMRAEDAVPLDPAGPPAYFSTLPLKVWAERLRSEGIPAEVSHHAGTYLCNAALYWSHHVAALAGYPTRGAFLHLPLASEQAIDLPRDYPSLPVALMARGVRRLLDDLHSGPLV
jgi:pyroglutamyl-peptidase